MILLLQTIMNSVVTCITYAFQVTELIGPASSNRLDVMHLRCWCCLIVLHAFFAQGMHSDITVSYSFPVASVSLVSLVVASMFFVVLIDSHPVLFTVAASFSRSLTAPWIGTARPWCSRHNVSLPLLQTKAFKG